MKGTERFSYGIVTLMGGLGVVPVVMGLFGIPEVFENIEHSVQRELIKGKIKGLLPTVADWKDSTGPIVRGSFLGFFLGILPGIGVIIPTFISYAMEKRLSKTPEKFGTGMIAGVAGPEAANNAAVGGSMVPLMALGIPPTATMALFMGALMIHGVQVGPFFIKEHGELFWGVIASMYVGNAMLLVLNLPLISIWVKLLKVPYWVLAPLILLFCLIGSYSVDGYIYDALLVVLVGILGYLMRKFQFEPTPFFLAFILGPRFEMTFRQSLIYSHGDLLVFFKRPISVIFMIAAFLVIASNFVNVKKRLVKKEGEIASYGQALSAVALLVFAALFFLQATHYRTGSLRSPEPGLFSAIVGGILGVLALVFLIRMAFAGGVPAKGGNPWIGLKWHKTLCVSLSLILYVLLFDAAGFLLSTLLLMQVLFMIGRPEKWLMGALGTVLSSGVSYIIFKMFLKIQLPAGVIENLLHLH